jgi:nitrite reductase/ring-hydroxylating ferredoxin subunit
MPRLLCLLDDIEDGHAREVDATAGANRHRVIVLRRGDEAWAYENVCPHFSIPLNYEADTFWTYDAELLMCAHHSAMFRFEDGLCVDGPCQGAALARVAIRVDGRRVVAVQDDVHTDAAASVDAGERAQPDSTLCSDTRQPGDI